MYDFLIVGAGLFGATVANVLHQVGLKCLVVEKRAHVAGNAYTEIMHNITVHKYGAHIFHTDNSRVWEYVNQFACFNSFINSPIANYRGELYQLPFNMHTFYAMWGVRTPEEAKARIRVEQQKSGITEPKNLREQGIYLVGEEIYLKLIEGYTEKQWGMSATQLSPTILQRVPLRFTFDNNYFQDKYQGIPVGGYTHMVERMLDGIDLRLNTEYHAHKEELDGLAKQIIYTGPIDAYYEYCYGALGYRSLMFDEQVLPTEDFQGNAVVNYTDAETSYTRIIEHKHFEKTKSDCTVITHEYPRKWSIGEAPYYPINDSESKEIYEKYVQLSKQDTRVVFGGRLGTYQYLDMDDVILSALETAELLKGNEDQNRG